jgi:hypothetical protein
MGFTRRPPCEVLTMKKFFSANDHVLPRPPEKLPEYAHAKARNTLAEKLVAVFQLSESAASAFANAVVDPAAVRKSIGEPDDPRVERIAVPGGKVLGIRTEVWARRIVPNPGNPRTLPNRRRPFAVEPGSAGEDSRFRPVPEPRSPQDRPDTSPELVVDIDSRLHLEWAAAQAADYVLSDNDWRESIKAQGVMEGVWLAATTFIHEDGSATVTVPLSVEGSSRTTAVHNILDVRSSDVPYEETDTKLRAHYKRLNDAFERRTETPEQAIMLRCERMPALLLVGFEKNGTSSAGFPTAVRSLVALRHVDPPKPWGEGPANEALSDEVLDELRRRNLITASERDYYAGSITKAQARDAHLPNDPAVRAAKIVGLFARADDPTGEAIRIAVTSQSTRRRITRKMCNELATALIVRSVALTGTKVDQVRRYMRNAFGTAVYGEEWEPTARDVEPLVREALREVRTSITDENLKEPGPASLELAVRAAYPLVVSGSLNDDRGTANNIQPDRRNPGEVLDTMRRSLQGVYQLARALTDFAAGEPIRAVDEDGAVKQRPNGHGELIVTDVYLREQFPAPGKARARSGGATPSERLKDRIADLSDAMDKLEEAFNAVVEVTGMDGSPLVNDTGADPQFCSMRRQLLGTIGDELHIWARTFRQRHGVVTPPTLSRGDDGDSDGDEDNYEDEEDAVGAEAHYTAE